MRILLLRLLGVLVLIVIAMMAIVIGSFALLRRRPIMVVAGIAVVVTFRSEAHRRIPIGELILFAVWLCLCFGLQCQVRVYSRIVFDLWQMRFVRHNFIRNERDFDLFRIPADGPHIQAAFRTLESIKSSSAGRRVADAFSWIEYQTARRGRREADYDPLPWDHIPMSRIRLVQNALDYWYRIEALEFRVHALNVYLAVPKASAEQTPSALKSFIGQHSPSFIFVFDDPSRTPVAWFGLLHEIAHVERQGWRHRGRLVQEVPANIAAFLLALCCGGGWFAVYVTLIWFATFLLRKVLNIDEGVCETEADRAAASDLFHVTKRLEDVERCVKNLERGAKAAYDQLGIPPMTNRIFTIIRGRSKHVRKAYESLRRQPRILAANEPATFVNVPFVLLCGYLWYRSGMTVSIIVSSVVAFTLILMLFGWWLLMIRLHCGYIGRLARDVMRAPTRIFEPVGTYGVEPPEPAL